MVILKKLVISFMNEIDRDFERKDMRSIATAINTHDENFVGIPK